MHTPKDDTMATDRLNNLAQQQLTEAVQHIVDSPKFWVNNGHIPVEIRRQIKEDILKENGDLLQSSPHMPQLMMATAKVGTAASH